MLILVVQAFQVLVIAVEIYTSRIKLPVEMPIIPIISNSEGRGPGEDKIAVSK